MDDESEHPFSRESPLTLAALLTCAPAAFSARMFQALSPARQAAVLQCLIESAPIPRTEIAQTVRSLNRLADWLSRCAENANDSVNIAGGPGTVAEILLHCPPEAQSELIQRLTRTHPSVAQEVLRLQLTFTDLARADDRSLQTLLREVSHNELATALIATDKTIRAAFLRNLSVRAAAIVHEALDYMGPTRLFDVEAARRKLVETALRLEESGNAVFPRSRDDFPKK